MTPNRTRQFAWGVGLVAAGALAGTIAAAAIPAGAQTPSPSTPGSTTTTPADPAKPRGQHPGETLLTGTNADKAKAAALKALPGATIERLETDAEGAVYEAHVTKADGTRATVKFDKDFNVTGIETGGGGHGHGGGDASSTSTTSTTGTA